MKKIFVTLAMAGIALASPVIAQASGLGEQYFLDGIRGTELGLIPDDEALDLGEEVCRVYDRTHEHYNATGEIYNALYDSNYSADDSATILVYSVSGLCSEYKPMVEAFAEHD